MILPAVRMTSVLPVFSAARLSCHPRRKEREGYACPARAEHAVNKGIEALKSEQTGAIGRRSLPRQPAPICPEHQAAPAFRILRYFEGIATFRPMPLGRGMVAWAFANAWMRARISGGNGAVLRAAMSM